MVSVIAFGCVSAAALIITVFLAWWAYENDVLAPIAILMATMGETAFFVACLVYLTMMTFGG